MAKAISIWISYDFGLKGDYNGLYTWLDNHKAAECGSNLAFFHFPTVLNGWDEICNELTKQLTEFVKLSKSDRIYVVFKDYNLNVIKGKFINGGRKQSPWEGYGKLSSAENLDS